MLGSAVPPARSASPARLRVFCRRVDSVRHYIGLALQFVALVFLPLLIIWQLNFSFPLIWMPLLLLLGLIVFTIGTRLRES